MKRLLFLVSLLPLVASTNLEAASSRRVEVRSDDGTYVEEEEDVWYGPGFYYGVWFDDEDEYWGWRRDRRDYPSHRNYYHRSRPIHYNHEDHHNDGGHGGSHGGGHK